MDDIAICKRIAEIEKLNGDFGVHFINGEYGRRYIDGSFSSYNPLTDDALCFQLMIKHQIDFYHAVYTDETIRRYEAVNAITGKGFGFSGSANKVICLAIIELHK